MITALPASSSLSTRRNTGLDHLRALAISLVFVFHYRLFDHPEWVVDWGSFGWTGVDLFFVLSGYLIAGQLFREVTLNRFSPGLFFIKRFFRILPAYWFVLGLYFLVPVFREWEHLAPLWRFLSFTQNFGLDRRYERTFSHAWSLCVEEQFYLLLPISILLLRFRKWQPFSPFLILSFFIGGFIIRLFSWYVLILPSAGTDMFNVLWFKWMYYPTYNRLDGLLAGITLAGIHHFFPRIKEYVQQHIRPLLITGLLLITAAYFLCRDFFSFYASIFGYPLIALAYGCLVGVASFKPGKVTLLSKITSIIATFSYSIYLTHKGVIHLTHLYLGQTGIHTESTVMFLCCIVTCLLAGALMYYCIEKPFLKIKDRCIARYFGYDGTKN